MITSSFLLASFYFLSAAAYPAGGNEALKARTPPGDKSVIIQMFQWNWDSVAKECTDFIGPAGYGFVQVSPPQEHIQGDQWWTDYQPVSYTLTSKRGNREQFAKMIETCHAAGVKVLIDTLWNHMAGVASGTGTAGTNFTHYSYPGLYENDNFHHCGLEPNDLLVDFFSAAEVQTCELVGLADLATETNYVRERLAGFGNDLLSLGADGFRIDAAKHMAADDIANVISRLDRQPFISQEVVFGEGEPIQPNQYVGNGDVQEFRYTAALKNAFLSGNLSSLQDLGSQNGWLPSASANVFVTNHDTERGGGSGDSLNVNSPNNIYTLAMVFSLAHPYGSPTILSSYSFADKDAGGPNGGFGTCSEDGGANGWLCQHRWTAVAGMAGFRNNVRDAPLVNWVSAEPAQIAFSRGDLGFIAINSADNDWSATFTTTLPDGTYCDVVSGAISTAGCTDTSFTISGGSFTATVPGHGAVAIHAGARLGA